MEKSIIIKGRYCEEAFQPMKPACSRQAIFIARIFELCKISPFRCASVKMTAIL